MHSPAPALAPSGGHPLPARLRHGIEQLSCIAMDDVSVHYNSPRPAALQALAYAQGADIHLAPRQERHLPHEAWHVVQQKQRRVPPTLQMKAAAPLNDDAALEREAELMGRRAAAYPARDAAHGMASGPRVRRSVRANAPGAGGPAVVQRFELSELGMTELATFVVATAGLAGLYTLNLLRRNWPARGPLEILGFMKAAGFQEGFALSRLAGWSSESVLELATAFGQSNPRQRRPVQDWIEVARLTGNDTPAEAATFSRLPAGWSSESVLELANAFNHAGGDRRPAKDWIAIARRTGDDTPATAASFSRLPAGWTLPGIQKLLDVFTSNTRGNLDADQWATIASRLGNDLADDTIAFCRLQGWQFANIDALAAAFAHKRNHLSRQNWLEVARRFGNDQDAATIQFCQLENWTWAGIRPLSVAFKADHNDLSADQWSSVAARVTDNDADSAIAFCQLENWDWHSIDALSQAYANQQRGLTGEQWQAIAEPAAEAQRANIPGFLAQVRISDPDATGDAIAELAHAGDDRFDMLTVMLNTIGNIAVADLEPLVTAFLQHQAAQVATIPQFLQAVRHHNPATTATQVALLINAVAARGTLAQIRTLVNRVAARNTLVELTALVRTIQQRQAGTLLPATDALVQHMPLAANVCVTLRDIVNTVAGHGSFAEIDAMVQQAVASLGENDVQALQPLLQRNPATNTPVHVTAFLNALPPRPTHLRGTS
ncbi:eCIS core domain-containing protein [Burkholderia gladioli]